MLIGQICDRFIISHEEVNFELKREKEACDPNFFFLRNAFEWKTQNF